MLDRTVFNLKGGDTYNNSEVSLNVPSTGMIQKSNPKSRFINVKKGSKEFDCLFPHSFEEQPRIEVNKKRYEEDPTSYGFKSWNETTTKEVTILQCMVYGNDEFFVEYVINEEL